MHGFNPATGLHAGALTGRGIISYDGLGRSGTGLARVEVMMSRGGETVPGRGVVSLVE